VTARDTTLVGALLDHRYLVTGLLARGGMSTVYRGMDTRLERPVAIKVMHQQYAADRSWAQRFQREALAAAKLHHQNVVGVYDQGVDQRGDEAHAFLVMELVDGGTLRDLLDERGSLPPALAVAIAEKVLAALAAAHKAGLIHRDIKPENVLIGHGAGPRDDPDAGSVKVADFGLVRAIASAGTTSSSVILGTVAYLSPEQVETGLATERSDVYSTGLLMYEMLTGKPAFSGDTALSVAYQHVNADVPSARAINPDVPVALDELVVRATRRDPEMRPADAAAFLAELRQVRVDAGLPQVTVPAVPPPDGGGPSPETTVPAMSPVLDDGPTGRSTRPQESVLHGARPPVEPEPEPRGNGLRIAFWAAVTLLVGGLLAVGVWIFVEAGAVKVPKLAGMTQARAEKVLQTAELESKIVVQRHNSVDAGRVISSDPPAGSDLRQGDTVTVLISAGKPSVPDIAEGTSRAEAEAAIKRVQLKPAHESSADEYHETIAKGAVISTDPAAGTELDIGEKVQLILSKGPPPTPVPDVKGLSKEDAFKTLESAGFKPYEAGQEFAKDIEAGKVVRTDPAVGETPEGSKPRVGVYISNAVTVPRLFGSTLEEAQQVLADLGLQAKVTQPGSLPGSRVWTQSPGEGEKVEPNSTVELELFP
jgi:beta-lactam-binding protein with PASTA domain/serine/threonine protein kinase